MKKTSLVCLITIIVLGNLTAQSTWVPDPTFGNNGITTVEFSTNQNDTPNDILFLFPDNKILTAGISILSPSVVYFYCLQATDFVKTKKLLLIK